MDRKKKKTSAKADAEEKGKGKNVRAYKLYVLKDDAISPTE